MYIKRYCNKGNTVVIDTHCTLWNRSILAIVTVEMRMCMSMRYNYCIIDTPLRPKAGLVRLNCGVKQSLL